MISLINGKYICRRTMPPSSYWPSWKAAMTVRTQKRFSTRWDPLNWYVSRFALTHVYRHGANSACHVSLRWMSWRRRILRFWRARRMTTAWETKSSPEMLDTTFTSWPIRCAGVGRWEYKYTTVFFFSGPEQEWTRCCTEKCVVVHLRFCVSACSRVYFCCQVQTFSHSFSTSASSASAPAASFRILITYLGVVVWGFFSFEPSPGFNFLHYRKLL